MESKNKKYDWSIATGSQDDIDISYVNIIKNKSAKQLGQYIKTHVAELYDHFTTLLDTEYGGKIRDMMIKINNDYKIKYREAFMQTPGSKKDFNKYTKKITKELDQFDDTDIYNEFYGEKSRGYFVIITKLNKTRQHILFEKNSDS